MASSQPTVLPDLNSGPRNFTTSPDDHSGIALVICTLLAVWALLSSLVRVYMRWTVSGPFGLDDYMCGVATTFGIIQTIVACVAISYGFGKSTNILTSQQIVQASKTIYSAQLLYIVTVALTKCTVSLLLARIVFIKNKVQACYGVLAFSVAWGVASLIAVGARCSTHPPWNIIGPDQCTNMLTAWEAITAFNIVIELMLFALPIWLVWNLQTHKRRKFTVVAVFSLRLPVVAATLARIYYMSKTVSSPQPLLTGVVPFICLNVEMHYGLMAATFPTLKPFVTAFNTGWGTYDTQGVSGYGHNSNGSYALNSLERKQGPREHQHRTSKPLLRPFQRSNARSNSIVDSVHSGGATIPASKPGVGQTESITASPARTSQTKGRNITHVHSLKDRSPSKHNKSPRIGSGGAAAAALANVAKVKRNASTGSASSKQQMIIRQTRTCEVRYEDGESGVESKEGRPDTGESCVSGNAVDFAGR